MGKCKTMHLPINSTPLYGRLAHTFSGVFCAARDNSPVHIYHLLFAAYPPDP